MVPDRNGGRRKRPGRKRGTDDTFLGRGGQLAVVAELMQRKCNAAIPEVDVGTDVFAFKDDREEVARIQVKTNSSPREYKKGEGYSARFAIPLKQLEHLGDKPALYYVLVVRLKGKWTDFLVISRTDLKRFYASDRPFGSANRTTGDLEITVEFREGQVTCSGRDLTSYRDAWDTLPPLKAPVSVSAPVPGTGADRTAVDVTAADLPAGEERAVSATSGGARAADQSASPPAPAPPLGDEPAQPN